MTIKYTKLISEHPIFNEWHNGKNKDLDPNKLTIGSNKKAWWKCSKDISDHVWKTSIHHRAIRKQKCPFCLGRKLSKTNRLDLSEPELVLEWDFKKNKKKISEYKKGSNEYAWWKCTKNSDHPSYKTKIATKVYNYTGCPYCVGQKVSKSNSLLFLFPKIAKELHPTKNKKKASELTGKSGEICFWKCTNNKNHEPYPSTVYNRTIQGSGCPKCRLVHASKKEILLLFELKRFFKIDPLDKFLTINKKLWNFDIIIRNKKTIIEYDGARYHKKKKDNYKNKEIKKLKGWNIIRVREQPLKKVGKRDIVINNRGEMAIILATAHICKKLKINQKNIEKILDQEKLLNTNKANKFIDNIYKGKINYIQKSGPDPKKLISMQQVLNWCNKYINKYKKYPTQNSIKKVKGMKKNTWMQIHSALTRGDRGLSKTGGLTKLLAKEYGYIHKKNTKDLNVKNIINWMKLEFKKRGVWPNANDKEVLAMPNEKWSNINNSLSRGRRGLKKGNSLSKIRDKYLVR